MEEIKWTGCGFKWNKESKEALGGLFHFSLDQVSKNGPSGSDVYLLMFSWQEKKELCNSGTYILNRNHLNRRQTLHLSLGAAAAPFFVHFPGTVGSMQLSNCIYA